MATSTQTMNDEYIAHTPTYHTDKRAQYILPNSAIEQNRLEVQARHLSNIMGGELVHAPLDPSSIQRALDIGCGTGIVTNYLARQYPSAQAIGLDLSPVPNRHDREGNVRFLQGNILTQQPSEWKSSAATPETLPNEAAFDLTFSRLLLAGISDWPLYIQNCFKLLRPGGWTEIQDIDWAYYRLAEYSASGKEEEIPDTNGWFFQKLKPVLTAKGIDFNSGSKAAGWMRDAGFQDIQVHTYRWPFGGSWESNPAYKAFGEYNASDMPALFHHLISRTMEGVASEEEIERIRSDMRKDMRDEPGRVWKYYVTVGRKP
ncbi:S-adenosyl-L-methionine-dependent methyltransferase [Teratosphaeria nubilosa]|uniref:S-adenosyl-L-methionine-dependent methyltransferase n=1 Tax=Teratosphaeria nubilosa TaxID=161662 RepID=A0A6G1L5J9_9PEZI|nr:S-adenosyl-L-methionine-dependent methyltransferase [Teratosphaeria nubilosa]